MQMSTGSSLRSSTLPTTLSMSRASAVRRTLMAAASWACFSLIETSSACQNSAICDTAGSLAARNLCLPARG